MPRERLPGERLHMSHDEAVGLQSERRIGPLVRAAVRLSAGSAAPSRLIDLCQGRSTWQSVPFTAFLQKKSAG
ncbi:hypothetical protein OKW42_008221 [Paraburkholderia sp. WC7.3d]